MDGRFTFISLSFLIVECLFDILKSIVPTKTEAAYRSAQNV